MKQKIKILQIIPNLKRGGAEKVCLQLATNLDKNKYEEAILLFKDGDQDTSWRENYKNNGGLIFSLKKNSRYDLKNFYQIFKIIKNWQPDIVHTHLGGDIYGVLAAKLAGIKIIITSEHNLNVSETTPTTLVKKLCLKMTDKTITVSEAVKRDALKRYCLNQNTLQTIYNGLPDSDFKNNRDNYHNPIVIGSLGRLVPQKGFKILIEAMSLIKNKNCRLIIGGEGELRSDLEKLVNDLELKERIELLGRMEADIFWPKIDIFVLSSLWEGLGLVALEAGARKKPLIVSDVDGLKEIINEQTGYLFKPSSAPDLALKIDYLLENLESPEVTEKINSNYQNIKNNFSVDKMVKSYEAVYQQLLSKYENTPS